MVEWRYIPFQYYDPYVKTGLNTVSIQSVQKKQQPVFWLAGWEKNCVNLGRGQNIEKEVNLDEVEERDDVVVVRRQGGGGATYLTRDGEITWNLAASVSLFPENVNAVYETVCGHVIDALQRIGVEAWHEPVNDVVTDQGKVSGATVKKKEGVVYAAGTLLYDVDVEEMFTVLTPGKEKTRDKEIDRVEDRVASITDLVDASFEDVVSALQEAFLAGKNWARDTWTQQEQEKAMDLAQVYKSHEWIHNGETPTGVEHE